MVDSGYLSASDLAEVIIHDRALSSTERASVDAYIRNKYFPVCGDGVCSSHETSSTCSVDCGCAPGTPCP